MTIFSEHKLVIASGLFLVGALFLGASLLWYGSRDVSRSSTQAPGANTYVGDVPPPAYATLQPGEANPADSLPYYDSKAGVLGGIVKGVSGTVLTITKGRSDATMEVSAAGATIYKLGDLKDTEVYQKEMAAFNEKSAYAAPNTTKVFIAPSPNEQLPVKLSDIAIGTPIAVYPKGPVQNGRVEASLIEVFTMPQQ
jgi:hypothetical protein